MATAGALRGAAQSGVDAAAAAAAARRGGVAGCARGAACLPRRGAAAAARAPPPPRAPRLRQPPCRRLPAPRAADGADAPPSAPPPPPTPRVVRIKPEDMPTKDDYKPSMEEEHAAQHAFEYAPIPGDNPWGAAALIVAGLRAEEVPRVRQMLDEMGGHGIKVLPATREQFRTPLIDVLRGAEPDWAAPRRDETAVLYDAAPGAQRVVIFSGLDTGERSAIATALARHGMRPPPAMAVAQERHATRPLADLLAKAVKRRLREVAVTDEKRVHLAAEAAREAAVRAKAEAEAAAAARREAARGSGTPERDDVEAALADANAAANAAARAAAKAAKASRVPFTGWPSADEVAAEKARARAAAADDDPDSDDEDDGSAFDTAERERPYKRAAEASRLAHEKEARDAEWRAQNGIVEDYGVPRELEPYERPDYDPDADEQPGGEGTVFKGRDGAMPEANGELPTASGALAEDEAKARGFMEELQRSREAGADLSFLRNAREAAADGPDANATAAEPEPAWFAALKEKYDMPAVWGRLRDAQLPLRDPAEEAAAAVRAAARAKAKATAKAPELRMGKVEDFDDDDLLGSDLPGIDEDADISMDTALDEIRAAREAVGKQIRDAEAAKRPQQPQRRSFGPEPPAAR